MQYFGPLKPVGGITNKTNKTFIKISNTYNFNQQHIYIKTQVHNNNTYYGKQLDIMVIQYLRI